MKIPKKLKVGGVVYDVNITDKLELGYQYSGEILRSERKINIRPIVGKEETFLHEVVHAILYMGGYTDHDEKMVEAISQGLWAVIVDNEKMFKG